MLALLTAPFLFQAPAAATPAQIILVRHAEKLNDYALCDMGRARAEALAKQYIGRDASQSLFGAGGSPAALFAITLHTFESISPTAQSWNMPVTDYSVVPSDKKELDENERTREAAHDVLTDPRYDGKTVLIMWEHARIASASLEAEYKGQEVSWRQLLHLDKLAGVPDTWPEETYNYFWIVDYKPGDPVPASFKMVRQAFAAPYADLPSNDWNAPEPRHKEAGCKT